MVKSKTLKHQRRKKRSKLYTRKNKHTSFKKLKCAPKLDNTLDFTCYTSDKLDKLRKLWNARHPDRAIYSNDPQFIWDHLKQSIGNACNTESCWLKQNFVKNKLDSNLLNYTFAPTSPKEWNVNPTEWLSSIDIADVMKQYENIYTNFEFIGPSPINFDTHKMYGECVWEELCNFNLQHYIKEGKNKIGVVFNLDPDYKEGSHWVALFINIKTEQIMFFCSYGDKPHRQIIKFMNKVKKQGKELGLSFKKIINNKRHQYTDGECGMYCLYFIISLIKTNNISKFNKRIHDDKMIKLRRQYFNKHN